MTFKCVITKDLNRHSSHQFTVLTVPKTLTTASTISIVEKPMPDFDTMSSAVDLLSACPIPCYRQHIAFVTSHSTYKPTGSS